MKDIKVGDWVKLDPYSIAKVTTLCGDYFCGDVLRSSFLNGWVVDFVIMKPLCDAKGVVKDQNEVREYDGILHDIVFEGIAI